MEDERNLSESTGELIWTLRNSIRKLIEKNIEYIFGAEGNLRSNVRIFIEKTVKQY